jgi:hypothetical protein
MSSRVEGALELYGQMRDNLTELAFLSLYGSPWLQALVGLRDSDAPPRRRPGEDPDHRAFVQERLAELRRRIAEGGPREAVARALIYIRMPGAAADERVFNLLRRMREERGGGMTLTEFKALLRDQFLMLLVEPEAALAALPRLLEGASDTESKAAIRAIRQLIESAGPLDEEGQQRLAAVERIFAGSDRPAPVAKAPSPAEEASAHRLRRSG